MGEAARSSARPQHPSATPTVSTPESPANQLLVRAHDWSASAQSEDDFSRIIETCRRAQTSQPSADTDLYASELASWALNRRGQLKAESGRDNEAIRDFDDAVRADAQRWRAIHNRGVLLAQVGEFEKAFDDFNRTVEINPEFAKAYSNRAALFVVAGNLKPALQDYARAIELDPTLAVAHRGRGRACHLVGRLDQAINHYDEAVRLAPDDAYAAASRADVLTDLGRYAEAARQYERAIEIDPKSSHAYSGSAWLLATCPDDAVRNSKLAIERSRTVIELTGGEDAASFDTLAAALASAGNFPDAVKTVRQAVHLATADEREVFQDRLLMYQHAKPYRTAPVDKVVQANYESH
jgi:tetratricopeptide (TPR) repeat protein